MFYKGKKPQNEVTESQLATSAEVSCLFSYKYVKDSPSGLPQKSEQPRSVPCCGLFGMSVVERAPNPEGVAAPGLLETLTDLCGEMSQDKRWL